MELEEKKIKAKELIIRLLEASGSDAEDIEISQQLKEIVPDPKILDYIFWSTEFYDKKENLDIDKLLNKALAYKPNVIAL